MDDERSTSDPPATTDGSDEPFDPSTGTPGTECTVALPDDLVADLDDLCRSQYVHRDEAIRSLLADWLDRRAE